MKFKFFIIKINRKVNIKIKIQNMNKEIHLKNINIIKNIK